MSFLESLFGDWSDSSESSRSAVSHPCSNCPSNCAIYPAACSVCQPYKEKLIDALYNVDHKDEILAKYEVVGTTDASSGFVTCPYCGAQSANPYVCEYCDSKLQEGSAKIKVASAKDLPNPVLDAQDLIFERYDAISNFVDSNESGLLDSVFGNTSSDRSGSFLGSIFSLFTGTDEDTDNMGCKMTEDEINQMAKTYGVSVSSYLAGLDNGIYSTLSAKQREDELKKQWENQQTMNSGMGSGLGMGLGAAGLAALLGSSFSSMSGSSNYGDLFGTGESMFGQPQQVYRTTSAPRRTQTPPPPQPRVVREAPQHRTSNNPGLEKVRENAARQRQAQQRPTFGSKTVGAAPVRQTTTRTATATPTAAKRASSSTTRTAPANAGAQARKPQKRTPGPRGGGRTL